MKKNLTEMVFIIDKSGSMCGLENDTIGGFNSMLEKQKNVDGDAIVTTVLFNHEAQTIHDRFNINDVSPMTADDYVAGGCTALLDAVGNSIERTVNVQKHLPEEARAEKVIFVIITDGYENASKRFTYKKLKSMIDHEQNEYGWEFIFLGANIDAVSEGAKFGIREDRAVKYKSDSVGTVLNYEVLGDAVSEMRAAKGMRIDGGWKVRIEKDVAKRGE